MKKSIKIAGIIATTAVVGILVAACATAPAAPTAQRMYVGHSWGGERAGVTLENATSVIETRLFLDANDIITDVQIDFLLLQNGRWIQRNNSRARVSINFAVTPTAATPAATVAAHTPGASMFTIDTNDLMSFYAVGVDTDGTVAFVFVDPTSRYQLEARFPPDFDFSQPMGNLGQLEVFIPTVFTSGTGFAPNADWIVSGDGFTIDLHGQSIFDTHPWNHVIYERGTFQGTGNATPLREFLELAGVVFGANGVPMAMAPRYGFHSVGGWEGNFVAIRQYMVGRNAREVTGFGEFSPRHAAAINPQTRFFHWDYIPDGVTGATATWQDSFDGIAGATVRISRENTSFQRALVAAGFITEAQVIRGRF
ncbi:MAG: hypothetical protein FWG66_07910 [Spirochaetes bacterium]|nr:hypothetical protein [Spirochaetota bacterium]